MMYVWTGLIFQFSSFPQIIILLFVLLLSFVILGRLTLKIFRLDQYLSSHFALNVPIYGVAGFLFATLVLNVIAIFFIGFSSLIIFLIITVSSVFILWKLGDISSLFRKAKNLNLSLIPLHPNLVPFVLVVLTFYHFSRVIEIMGWPPIGDILLIHGPFTSALLYNGKITLTLEPISSGQVSYPMGFHTVAAHFASWFNIFPGEAVFLLGGLIIILIPLLMYSLAYVFTKSISLSLLTYFATFIIHPSFHLERWMVGYFYNGPYPNLAGFLIVLFSIYILGLEYVQPEKVKKQDLYLCSAAILFLSLLVLLLVYPSFIILVSIILIFMVSKHGGKIVILVQRKPILILPPLLYGLLFLFIPHSYVHVYSQGEFTKLVTNVYTLSVYTIPSTFLFDHITGYVMWVALTISIALLLRKRYPLLSLFYILLFCILLFTTSPMLPSILYTILPSRAVMILWITSWFIMSLGITEFFSVGKLKKHFKPFIKITYLVILVSLLMIPPFAYSLIQEFSYINALRWSWYTRSPSFSCDFVGLLWINYNIPPKDLILTDQSFASYWILSFSAKNITFFKFMNEYEIERGLELEEIWNKPYEIDTVYQLLSKYNVSYVFVTSEWGYYRSPAFGERVYKAKPYTPQTYVSIFDTYPFLKTVFRLGLTTVYKVDFNLAPE
ncbi:MAG: hypothetical protein QXR19_04710 [Candidatus Jordarchaeaceae archaeon]